MKTKLMLTVHGNSEKKKRRGQTEKIQRCGKKKSDTFSLVIFLLTHCKILKCNV